jgi:glycosyltransferase involved in cell wall biosynthesis
MSTGDDVSVPSRTSQALDRLERANPWYRPSATASSDGLDGVNVAGYLRDESGWGSAVRGYVRALEAAGIPVALRDFSELTSNRSHDPTLTVGDGDTPYDVNLVCVDARQHFSVLHAEGLAFFEGRYNIGAWAWELPRIPDGWYDRFAYYDEIWVATSFIANAVAPSSPVPVVCLPPVLTPAREGSRQRGRERLRAGDDFVFLFVFDFHSHAARKNPAGAVEAFRRAFDPDDPVRLVVKCVNETADPAAFAHLEERARGHRVEIEAGYWESDAILDLMAAADCYVSLHRSEGTGLTIAESMALGKPVIATGWSGNMDYMSVANSFPVGYELVELTDGVGPYEAGETWAEPSIDHAAELMRAVFDEPEAAKARGERAHRDLAERYSEQAIGGLIRDRLGVIAGRADFPHFREELRRFFHEYGALVEEIRVVVEEAVPAGSTVLVVSRGDPDLVSLEPIHGEHFPQQNGVYAGHHPADSSAAEAELEKLRAGGADFILFPGTSFWWFEHYADFRRHLDDNYRQAMSDERCVLYDLRTDTGG